MTTTPNLYGFATKELAQDATIAYLLAWADPAYRESHPRLHTLGSELLLSLLQTQEIDLPQIETLCIKTQIDRIDIVVQINAGENGVLLLIEDKVNTQEHSNQIERYIEAAERNYNGKYDRDRLVAVYLKTGNESKASLPDKDKCGRFMRRDLLDILNRFQDTGNVIVDDFRIHLQGWEDETNRWESASYDKWEWTQWEVYQVLDALNEEDSDDIRIEKAGTFRSALVSTERLGPTTSGPRQHFCATTALEFCRLVQRS